MTDAALVNGIAAHALDFDDTHIPAISSPHNSAVCRGVGACRERRGSGIDVLAAHALGYEVSARVSNALYPEHYDVGWHMTGTTGALASAAVALRLLGLHGSAAVHCLGLAATPGLGHREQFGTTAKPFHAGHAAGSRVVVGTEMALADGFTSARIHSRADAGMFSVMSTATRFQTWSTVSVSVGRLPHGVKPYACGVVIHPAIDACGTCGCMRGWRATTMLSRSSCACIHWWPSSPARPIREPGSRASSRSTFACSIALLEGRAGEREFSDSYVVGKTCVG